MNARALNTVFQQEDIQQFIAMIRELFEDNLQEIERNQQEIRNAKAEIVEAMGNDADGVINLIVQLGMNDGDSKTLIESFKEVEMNE